MSDAHRPADAALRLDLRLGRGDDDQLTQLALVEAGEQREPEDQLTVRELQVRFGHEPHGVRPGHPALRVDDGPQRRDLVGVEHHPLPGAPARPEPGHVEAGRSDQDGPDHDVHRPQHQADHEQHHGGEGERDHGAQRGRPCPVQGPGRALQPGPCLFQRVGHVDRDRHGHHRNDRGYGGPAWPVWQNSGGQGSVAGGTEASGGW